MPFFFLNFGSLRKGRGAGKLKDSVEFQMQKINRSASCAMEIDRLYLSPPELIIMYIKVPLA